MLMVKYSNQTLLFEEISELNGKDIFSISGICCHCFAVSKDGKVFVCGNYYASDGRLGLGKNRTSEKFIEITSLHEYKICAAYAGVYHSLFQTQEGKLFSCGNNEYGQLLLKNGPSEVSIYEPVETSSTNVSFCITGNYSTVIFKNREPPMSPNKQVDYTKLISIKSNSETRNKSEISSLKLNISELEKQLNETKSFLEDQKNRFNSQLSKKDAELKEQQEKYEQKIEKLKKEKSRSAKAEKVENIDILDGDTIRSLEKLEKISSGSYGKVYKVAKRIIYALKVMKINVTQEEFQKFIQEYELMHLLSHPNIVKTYGIFLSDETHPPSILLEFCPTNLD